MTRTAPLALVLFLAPAMSLAQTTQQSNDVGCLDPAVAAPQTIHFGVLNSKGINIPKPVYPAAAKDAKISGVVKAVVVIDETGKVMWARVPNGNPLLRDAVKTVVCQARVKPIRLARHPVKFTGILTYRFVL
jgi:TonB family protein